MDPVALDVRLIRALIGSELRLAPGRALTARVVSADGSGRGSLSIAGAAIEAELPSEVRAGQELRLTVRQVTAERVVLSMSDPSAAPPAAVQLPGGGSVRLAEREEAAGGGAGPRGRHVLALRYDVPTLGSIDLRFELDPASLRVGVTMAAGDPFERAHAAAAQLQGGLEGPLERTVNVTVRARREPLDVYA